MGETPSVRGISSVRARLTRHRWLIAIAVAYLYVFPYFPRLHSANELPRVYLVKSIVHLHTFAIEDGVQPPPHPPNVA